MHILSIMGRLGRDVIIMLIPRSDAEPLPHDHSLISTVTSEPIFVIPLGLQNSVMSLSSESTIYC